MSETFSSETFFLFHDSQLKIQRQGKETMGKGERRKGSGKDKYYWEEEWGEKEKESNPYLCWKFTTIAW